MHILFINSWYPNRILKQNGDFIQRHAEAVALKHKVTAIHVKSDDNLTKKIEITNNTINGVRTIIAYVKPSKNPFVKAKRFFNAYSVLIKKAGKFDVVHVNKLFPAGFIAFLLKLKKNIPYIITEHHTIYHQPYYKKIGFTEKFISKMIAKNASFIAPVSKNLQQAMEKFGLKGNYTNVPNVVDTERFIPQVTENEVFTILHVSSMAKVKNIEGLLNTVKTLESKLNNFKFQMIGGDAEKYLALAEKLKINKNNILFKNQVSHKEITEYLKKADVFVLFSDVENLPCVILEAFSCGTPVISTDVGGISEYFPENFGILIQPKNQKQLVEAILKVKNGKLAVNKQKMHDYVVKNFSENNISKAFNKLYLQAIKNEQN